MANNTAHSAPIPADHPFAIRHAELTAQCTAARARIRRSYGLSGVGYLIETANPDCEAEVDASNARFAGLIATARAEMLG